MESVQEMVSSLGKLGDDALDLLHQVQSEARVALEKNLESFEEVGFQIDFLKEKGQEHFESELKNFDRMQQTILDQEASIDTLTIQLKNLTQAFSTFVSYLVENA